MNKQLIKTNQLLLLENLVITYMNIILKKIYTYIFVVFYLLQFSFKFYFGR